MQKTKPSVDTETLSEPKKSSGPKSPLVRLNKFLADCGMGSRRKTDELITSGLIKVNGEKVFELGVQVNPKKDVVTIEGKRIQPQNDFVYIAFNKPRGVLTSMKDPLGRPTVADFFEKLPMRVFPVGRLDWDSEGLLILTNDGEYAQKVTHPSRDIPKIYLVKVSRKLTDSQMDRLKRGVTIVGGRVKAEHIEKIKKGEENHPWYQIVISEGKNRQVRLMLSKVGADVIKLQRVAIGKLRLGTLERGQFLFMNKAAADRVFQLERPNEKARGSSTPSPALQKTNAAKTDTSHKDNKFKNTNPKKKLRFQERRKKQVEPKKLDLDKL